MSTLFFLFALLFGWQAWNLYYPNFTHPRVAVVSFASGWIVGELALHVIFWQAVIVAFFVLIGAVSGFFGALGFLICLASWAAMAYYYYQSTWAESEVDLALVDGLGADFESEINESARSRFPKSPDEYLLRHPFRSRDPLVEVIKDKQPAFAIIQGR